MTPLPVALPASLDALAVPLSSLLAAAPAPPPGTTFMDFIDDNAFWIIMGSVAVIAIVLGSIKEMVKHTARERTRREIAAYIAEGSMTPEQGERIMNAGKTDD